MRLVPITAILTTTLAGFAGPSLAQTTDEKLAICTIIEMPLGRLQCYDAIAGRAVEPSAAAEPEDRATTWEVRDDVSPLDRSRRIIAARESRNQDATGRPAVLAARCIENSTSIVVGVPDFLGSSSDQSAVQYRIGEMEPVSDRWDVGGDTSSLVFGPTGSAAITAIQRMAASADFVIRISRYNGEQVQYVFDLDGLADHLPLLAETCQWPAAPAEPPGDLIPTE